jgi:site-specific DNA-methyltransferase (cytosine-N4-specific)
MIDKWDELFGSLDYPRQLAYLERVWDECYRVLVDGGIACINIGDATRTIGGNFECYPNYAQMVVCCKRMGFTPLIPIFWKKISNRPNAFLGSGMLPPNGYVAQDCEYIAIFRKGNLRKFPPKDKNRYASEFTKEERDLWFQQVWEVNGKRGAGKTTAFPEEIPRRLIRMFSVLGDTVLDPFSGTGTTKRVAESLDRKFIGYEVGNDRKGKRRVRKTFP